MKMFPMFLAASLCVAASVSLPSLMRKDDGAKPADFAAAFVECARVEGAKPCGHHLEQWSQHPGARDEMLAYFARDKEFARYFMEYGDLQQSGTAGLAPPRQAIR